MAIVDVDTSFALRIEGASGTAASFVADSSVVLGEIAESVAALNCRRYIEGELLLVKDQRQMGVDITKDGDLVFVGRDAQSYQIDGPTGELQIVTP